MDAHPARIWDALEGSPESALDCQIQRREVAGHAIFVFHERLYTPSATGVREALGSNFSFEDEGNRERLASWLEMINVKNGDTLLHLVMRLNGIDDVAKARCAVEILGRGASFEIANVDGEICSMVDPAFKLAWLKELPAWKQRREERARQQRRTEADQRRRAMEQQRRDQARAEIETQQAAADEQVRRREAEVKENKKRQEFHAALERMLIKLEKRDDRQAKANPAWTELTADLRQIPRKIELWWNSF